MDSVDKSAFYIYLTYVFSHNFLVWIISTYLHFTLQNLDITGAVSKREAWATSTPPPTEEEVVQHLYDPDILKTLSSVQDITTKDENLYIRPLQSDDYHRGFIDLLKQLTSVGSVSESDFKGIENIPFHSHYSGHRFRIFAKAKKFSAKKILRKILLRKVRAKITKRSFWAKKRTFRKNTINFFF